MPRPHPPAAPPPEWRRCLGAGGSNDGGLIRHVTSSPFPQTPEVAHRAGPRVMRLWHVIGRSVCTSSRHGTVVCTRSVVVTLVPKTPLVATDLARALRVATRQSTGGSSRFCFKPDFNLERFGQPNIDPNSRFTAQSMASSRAAHIGPDDLIPGSGRWYPQQCLSQFVATQSVQETRTAVR